MRKYFLQHAFVFQPPATNTSSGGKTKTQIDVKYVLYVIKIEATRCILFANVQELFKSGRHIAPSLFSWTTPNRTVNCMQKTLYYQVQGEMQVGMIVNKKWAWVGLFRTSFAFRRSLKHSNHSFNRHVDENYIRPLLALDSRSIEYIHRVRGCVIIRSNMHRCVRTLTIGSKHEDGILKVKSIHIYYAFHIILHFIRKSFHASVAVLRAFSIHFFDFFWWRRALLSHHENDLGTNMFSLYWLTMERSCIWLEMELWALTTTPWLRWLHKQKK
jgi:hypothetical protein